MNKFLGWLYRCRKPLGYTLGIANILMGMLYLYFDMAGMGILWLVIGGWILHDALGDD